MEGREGREVMELAGRFMLRGRRAGMFILRAGREGPSGVTDCGGLRGGQGAGHRPQQSWLEVIDLTSK